MSELITEQEIINARNEAYKIAGHNAYFGNGFSAGVRFALEKSKANEMLEMLKSCLSFIDEIKAHGIDKWSDEDKLKQLIQQVTTIK